MSKTKSGAELFANVVLSVAGTFCVLAIVYFVYNSGLSLQGYANPWQVLLLRYMAPLFVALAVFATLLLRPPRKVNVALAVCSIGICVLSIELFLEVWLNLPSVQAGLAGRERVKAAKAIGIDFDTRRKQEVVEDLRKQGVDAVPLMFPRGLREEKKDGTQKSVLTVNGEEILPLAGVSLKSTVACNESGHYISFQSDEHGFNNPEHIWDRTSIDIAAVGDSFVEIWCVPPDKNFTAIIRQRYPATVNLGVDGNGPLCMLGTIKEYARFLKPKRLLWFYFEGNDIHDLEDEAVTPLLRSYLNRGYSQNLIRRQAEIDRVLLDFINAAKPPVADWPRLQEIRALVTDRAQVQGTLLNTMKLASIRNGLGLLPLTKQASTVSDPTALNARAARLKSRFELFRSILSEASTTANLWGGKLIFVYLPAWHRYAPGQEPNPDRDVVLRIVQDLGLQVIDVHQVFANHKDPVSLFPLRLDGHYTEEGNRIVAEYVLRALSDSIVHSSTGDSRTADAGEPEPDHHLVPSS